MHEFSLVDNLIKICEETAQKHELSRIHKVHICIGRLRQVVPETMHFAFEIAARQTRCQSARLDLEFLPIRVSCKDCDREFVVDDNLFQCPACKSGSLRLIQGLELFVQSIEGE